MIVHLIPGEGRYKDLPFYIKDHNDVYLLSEPGHHGDIITWMRSNGVIQGFNDDLIGGQFYFEDGELIYTLFGYEDDHIEHWCQKMIPQLLEQGASEKSFHDGTFHFANPDQLQIPGQRWSAAHYAEDDPDYWMKHITNGGHSAFGYVNGELHFGPNHSRITTRLLNNGMTSDQLLESPQAWGWANRNTAYFIVPENGIDVRFSSDDKYMMNKKYEDYQNEAKEAVMNLYRSSYLPRQTKTAFKWDPTYYKKQELPTSGCFGCLDGHLMLGIKHHQLIMAALINKGWSWAQMTKPHQSWGWYEIRDPERFKYEIEQYGEYDYYTYRGLPKEHSAKLWPFINVTFASDAGTMDAVGVAQAKQAFQTMYRLPVQIGATEDFGGVEADQYGKGLKGPANINKYLPGGGYEHLTNDIKNVPDPPPPEPWSDENEERLEFLQNLQQQGQEISMPQQNELLQLWMAKQEYANRVQAHFGKLASQQFKFVWADGIFEVTKGFLMNLHHFSILDSIVGKLGHEPQNYVAGDFTQDPFHPAYGALTIRWSEGQVPSPHDLKDMMQRYITNLTV